MDDELTYTIPIEYDEHADVPKEFLDMIERVFSGDVDKDQKKESLQEMFGACLMPIYPHLFMVHGQAGTGKSTILKLAMRLVSEQNISMVAPSRFIGFHMESMIGKLINVVTDIPTDEKISENIVKMIEDRIPMQVHRKFKRDIYSPLPAVHIFAGNAIPPTIEGYSKAHERRWTFISFNQTQTHGKYNKNFDVDMFNKHSQGILKYAVLGLQKLLDLGGHFTQPDSGSESLQAWQRENDAVAQFINDIRNGEVDSVDIGSGSVLRSNLWSDFKTWLEAAYTRPQDVGKIKFFKKLETLGFQTIRDKNEYRVAGICRKDEGGHPTHQI
jgi:phage/plasmid-associated DNA primase